jgi:hypothetical protein
MFQSNATLEFIHPSVYSWPGAPKLLWWLSSTVGCYPCGRIDHPLSQRCPHCFSLRHRITKVAPLFHGTLSSVPVLYPHLLIQVHLLGPCCRIPLQVNDRLKGAIYYPTTLPAIPVVQRNISTIHLRRSWSDFILDFRLHMGRLG